MIRLSDRGISLVFLGLLLSFEIGLAQTVADGYQVATWRHSTTAAISHTFDDNTSNQLSVALPLYDQYDFKITFFTTTGWGPNWTALAAAAANGHEVASHTVTHPYLNTLTSEGETEELANSFDAIHANIPGAGPLTLAYPYCVRSSVSVTTEYYFAARGCSGRIEPRTPADFLDISSFVIGTEGSVESGGDLINLANDAAQSGGWVVLLMHGVDNDGGWSPVRSSALKPFLQYLAAEDETFWVETFGNVVRYIRERDEATVTEVSAGDDSLVVSVSDPLDDDIYDYPITILRTLPDAWVSASVSQGGRPVASRLVEDDGESRIMFDVVPDAGDVVLTRRTTTRTEGDLPETRGQGNLIESFPNPARSSTRLAYHVGRPGQVTIELYDLLGRRLETVLDAARSEGRFEIPLDVSSYAPGTYIYRMTTESDLDAGILILN